MTQVGALSPDKVNDMLKVAQKVTAKAGLEPRLQRLKTGLVQV